MKPSSTKVPLNSDIQTLADYVHLLFAPTKPVEVINILSKSYHFRYCIDETVTTPDQNSRKVEDRRYDERDVEPGGTEILLGGAAFVFISDVATAYVFEKYGEDAVGQIELLAEAADKVLIGEVGYKKHEEQTTPEAPKHNPNAINDDSGKLNPAEQNNTQTGGGEGDDEKPFGNDAPVLTDIQLPEGETVIFPLDNVSYRSDVTDEGRTFLKAGAPISEEEFLAAYGKAQA